MLDHDTRMAILKMAEQGHSVRMIARTLKTSRNSVKKVLKERSSAVPMFQRPSQLEPHLSVIQELFVICKGNFVRVHEELKARHEIMVGYSTLTTFCREQGIGVVPKIPVGTYHFQPGQEMQHDTSPHKVEIDGRYVKVQCASIVLCYSRLTYAQVYERWRRFECRIFLTDAFRYFQGVAKECMLDNSTVIIGHGRGPDAVPAPEMQAFSKHFGFQFVAHHVGDADRSAFVERSFDTIENNFYPGRDFTSLEDVNQQLRAWCDTMNDRFRRHLEASPRTLWRQEQPALKPLPVHIPEVYETHRRRVDVEGYVNLHRNRYSVPVDLIGRTVEARETLATLRIFEGHTLVATHPRHAPSCGGKGVRITDPQHRGQGRWRRPRPKTKEELTLRAQDPLLGQLIDLFRKTRGGQPKRAVRHLHRIYLDYPTPSVLEAVRTALAFGLTDMTRIEQMILRHIAGDFFKFDIKEEPQDERRPGTTDEEPEVQEDPSDHET